MKSYHIQCPKCNNDHSFYRYGKDSDGYQKYLCRTCQHQFAPERPRSQGTNCRRKHPPCPVCGKASFLHHDHEHYSNYRCGDKKCNRSFFEWKSTAVTAPSMSSLFGKHNFKRMRYPVQTIITALSMFYLGKNSFRNISLILKTSSYNKIVVFIDRSPAECYNKFRMLWIGKHHLPQRRFMKGSNHSFFVEMLIS